MEMYEFIREYKKHNKYDHYFDSDTLKFFGERLSDMRILKCTEKIKDFQGVVHECYVLSKISRNFSGKRFRNYDYFDVNTYKRILMD